MKNPGLDTCSPSSHSGLYLRKGGSHCCHFPASVCSWKCLVTGCLCVMYFRASTSHQNSKTMPPLSLRYRKQLEEWQKSKGKVYKRPPMELRTKRRVVEQMNMSFWKSMETEREAQYELSSRISSTLAECLRLIEQASARPWLDFLDEQWPVCKHRLALPLQVW